MRSFATSGRQLALAMAVGLVVAGSGCGSGGTHAAAPGSARISVLLNLGTAARVSKVTVTVSPGDGTPTFTPIVKDLSKSGSAWTGTVGGIPPGTGRQFAAVAYDSAGKQLAAGSTKTDVVVGQAALVSLTLTGSGAQTGVAFPIIDSITASQAAVAPGGTASVGVTAHDPAGGTLSYKWTATCGTFGEDAKASTRWTAPATSGTCQLSIKVRNGDGASVTAYLTLTVSTSNGLGDAQVTAVIDAAPIIGSLSGSVLLKDPMEGDLYVTAGDPDGDAIAYAWSSSCATLTFDQNAPHSATQPHFVNPNKTDVCVITVKVSDARGASTTGVFTLPPYKAFDLVCGGKQNGDACDDQKPCTASDVCTNGVCAGTPKSCPTGQACNAATGACEPNATDLCIGKPACTATDDCHLPGTCNPATGLCSAQTPKADGTACSDGSPCTVGDVCGAGVCVPGAAKCAANQSCDAATGTCSGGGTCTPACSATQHCDASTSPGTCKDNCAGINCGAGTHCDAATNPGQCVANVCAPQCASGQSCDTSTNPGTCVAATCTPSCGVTQHCNVSVSPPACIDNCAGVVCGTGTHCDAATNPGACVANVCTPQCASGQTCDTSTNPGTCVAATCTPACSATQRCDLSVSPPACVNNATPTVPQFTTGKSLAVKQLVGAAVGLDGSAYVAGLIGCNFDPVSGLCLPTTFDTRTVNTMGGSDLLIVKYDRVTGMAAWALDYGGTTASEPSDQIAKAIAVTSGDTVAVVGTTSGPITGPGVNLTQVAGSASVLILTNGAGTGTFGKAFNLGNGQFSSVAASKKINRIALCGYADTNVTDLVPGYAGYLTAAAGNLDVVIGVYDVTSASAPTLLWSKQLGAGSSETCQAIAIDDNGDVIAAGQYNTATGQTPLNPGLGALPAQTNPNWKHLWVAKYNGASGTPIAQASFGGTGGNQNAYALDTDASGAIFIGGSFTLTLPFGAQSVTSPSGASGYVAKLDGTTLAPAWAVRAGNGVNGLAATSTGDVLAGGNYNANLATVGTNYSALTLTNAGGFDAYLLKLSGTLNATTGHPDTQFGAGYGDASAQGFGGIGVNRLGTGTLKDDFVFAGTYSGTITFPAPVNALPAGSNLSYAVLGTLGQ